MSFPFINKLISFRYKFFPTHFLGSNISEKVALRITVIRVIKVSTVSYTVTYSPTALFPKDISRDGIFLCPNIHLLHTLPGRKGRTPDIP